MENVTTACASAKSGYQALLSNLWFECLGTTMYKTASNQSPRHLFEPIHIMWNTCGPGKSY